MRKRRQFRAGRCYHLVSRIAHRAFFFDEEEKNRFVELLMRVEYFSGVRVIGWCVMSNHVHVYIYLDDGHDVDENELLAKINRLYRGTHIDCNPCEGGICKWPTEYKWCGWSAAMSGDEHARAMYRFIYGAMVEDENDWSAIAKRHEQAIRKRIGEIEEDEKAGRICDSIFGRLTKGEVKAEADVEATHVAAVVPCQTPEKWAVRLERGSNAVAAKLLTFLEGGDRSAAEIAEELGIKSRPFLTNYYLVPLMAKELIRQTLPDKPRSRFQRYVLVRGQ